jgi:hypothetical protein
LRSVRDGRRFARVWNGRSAVGAVAVGNVDGERRRPVKTGRRQAALETRGLLCAEVFRSFDRRAAVLESLALSPLDQRNFRLEKLLKHDTITIEAGVGDVDVQSRRPSWITTRRIACAI